MMKRGALYLWLLLCSVAAYADYGMGPGPGLGVSIGCTAPTTDGAAVSVAFSGSTASISLSVPHSGDAVLVGIFSQTTVSSTVAVSDGASYTQDNYSTTPSSRNSNIIQSGIWHLYGAGAGTHSIVVTVSAGSTFGYAVAIPVLSVAAASPVVNSNISTGSTNPAPGSATPAATCSFAFSVASLASNATTESFGTPPVSGSNNYTNLFSNNNGTSSSVGSVDYFIQSSTTTAQNPSYATFTNGYSWAASVAVYSGTGGRGGAAAIKWHPGFYMTDFTFTVLGNSTLSSKQSQIGLVRAGPAKVLGWMGWYQWAAFENATPGVYDFSSLDVDYVQLTTGSTSWIPGQPFPGYNSPRRLAIKMQYYDPFNVTTPQARALPHYIAVNSAYGPGPGTATDGSLYGYWPWNNSGTPGFAVATWRPAILARLQLLFQALGNHVLPDGNTVDSSPYVELIDAAEETSSAAQAAFSPADTTATQANYNNMWATIVSFGKSYFPHTNFGIPNNFYPSLSNQAIQTVNFENTFAAASVGSVSGDFTGQSYGINDLEFGWKAYIGLLPNSGDPGGFSLPWVSGGTNQQGIFPFFATVEGGDFYGVVGPGNTTPLDMVNNANNVMKATHMLITYIDYAAWGGTPPGLWGYWFGSAEVGSSSTPNNPSASQANWNAGGDSAGGVLTTIVNNSLTNTTCPSVYVSAGGCNTH